MSRYINILIWQYSFYQPEWLWGLLAIPIILWLWVWLQRKGYGQLQYTKTESQQLAMAIGWVKYIRLLVTGCYGISLTLITITLAQPYHLSYDPPRIDYKNGIDIVLSIDASVSMLSQDFEPNRLEVAKSVAKEFVDARKGDRIGLVVYEGEAYTACPATLDYKLLKDQITAIEPGQLEPGTAVGNGLAVAVARLRSDSLKSKVIILLTDGSSNAGSIEPMDAAKLAKNKKCRVYTIGVGSNGSAPTPMQTPFGIDYVQMPVEIDEMTLKRIASETDGKYFRATDRSSLEQIYKEINVLEKRKMENNQYGKEPPLTLFPFFVWAIFFALLAWGIQRWKFRLDD